MRIVVVPTAWESAIDGWDETQRLRMVAETSRYTRRQHLQHLARSIDVDDPWDVDQVSLVRWWVGQAWAQETRRCRRVSVVAFYDWAAELGHVAESPAAALPRTPAAAPRPRPAPDAAYADALAIAAPRERLMLRLAAEAGLRRGEVALVHRRDLYEDLGGWSLVVHGKGGKDRDVPLSDSLASAVLANLGDGWLFPGDVDGHLSARWVGKLITRLLPGAHTMHALRHRFATRAYEVDHDIMVVRDLLGHRSVATTERYVAADRQRRRLTVEAAS